jgi:hypothetical protein
MLIGYYIIVSINKLRLAKHLIKPWYFLIIAAVATVICVSALRANNEHMIQLRSAVYAADQNNTDVQKALQTLQAYVTTHMNTNLSDNTSVYPPIQLKYTYDRLVQAQTTAAETANTQLYTDAQTYCQQQNSTDFSGRNRVPCIEQYVQSHDTKLPQIPQDLYKFDFVSPNWSPDIAGWSMVIAGLSGALFLITLAVFLVTRRSR